METNIYFNIPGLYYKRFVTIHFLEYLSDHPEVKKENAEIGAIYDSIPYCIWNGGRIFPTYPQATQEDLEQVKDMFSRAYNKPIRLIYTNGYIEEKHLKDTFCNLVTEFFHDENNEIVVNSPLLEQYIRENYPKYKIISSTTKCLLNWDNIHEEFKKDYYQVCLDYNLNHNLKQLEMLTEEEKNKAEFLINAICPVGCPNRAKHYKLNSTSTLEYNEFFYIECPINSNTLACDNKTHISPEEIDNIYAPMGFKYFKLEGRTLSDVEVLCNYVKYLVKPEYQLQVVAQLLS